MLIAATNGPGYALTLALLAAGLGVGALAYWRHDRPPDPAKGPRMIPWMLIVLTAAAWTLVMLVHLVNLAGLQTGRF